MLLQIEWLVSCGIHSHISANSRKAECLLSESCRRNASKLTWGTPPLTPGNTARGVHTFGISGPHWKKSCLGPHIEYIVTHNHRKSYNILSKFMVLCWDAFIAILGHMQPTGLRLDTPTYILYSCWASYS